MRTFALVIVAFLFAFAPATAADYTAPAVGPDKSISSPLTRSFSRPPLPRLSPDSGYTTYEPAYEYEDSYRSEYRAPRPGRTSATVIIIGDQHLIIVGGQRKTCYIIEETSQASCVR